MHEKKLEINEEGQEDTEDTPFLSSNPSEEPDGVNFDKIMDGPLEKVHMYYMLILGLGNASDAVEVVAVGYVLKNYQDFHGLSLTAGQKGILSASVFAGMLIGGLMSGILSDRFGRKYCLSIYLGVNSLFSIAAALSPTTLWFIIFRFFSGVGVGGTIPCVISLATELFPSRHRGRFITFISTFWMIGTVAIAGIALLILGLCSPCSNHSWRWRWFLLASALPAVIATGFTWMYLPESPYYLLMQGQFNEAAKVIHQMTGVPIEKVQNMCKRRPAEKNSFNFKNTIAILCSGENRKIAIILAILWYALSYGYYGITIWLASIFSDIGVKNVYVFTMLYSLGSLPGNILALWLTDVLGRKLLLVLGLTISIVSAFIFSTSPSNTILVICACAFNTGNFIAWSQVDCLSGESFPTSVRGAGMGIVAISGRIGSIVAQVVNSGLENHLKSLFHVTGIVLIIGALSVWSFPRSANGHIIK